MSKRRNPYKKSKRTYIDEGVMKRIGWSEEDVICFVKDVEEEEKVETKNENQKVGAKQKEDVSGASGLGSTPIEKQTVVAETKSQSLTSNKITPEQKARINKNRIRASYIRQRNKRKIGGKGGVVSKVMMVEVPQPFVKGFKVGKEKKKEEERVIEEEV